MKINYKKLKAIIKENLLLEDFDASGYPINASGAASLLGFGQKSGHTDEEKKELFK